MFWRKQATVAVQVAPQMLVPIGIEATPTMEDNERIAYERTCKAIGFEPVVLLQARILSFFKKKGIRIFNNAEVFAYMEQKAIAQNKIWHWRPLRKSDVIDKWLWWPTNSYHGFYNAGRADCLPYQNEIPLRVLGTVEQIYGEFGEKVKFFVTNYTHPRPDPFIAVVIFEAQDPFIVFDYWDEPDFDASITSQLVQ